MQACGLSTNSKLTPVYSYVQNSPFQKTTFATEDGGLALIPKTLHCSCPSALHNIILLLKEELCAEDLTIRTMAFLTRPSDEASMAPSQQVSRTFDLSHLIQLPPSIVRVPDLLGLALYYSVFNFYAWTASPVAFNNLTLPSNIGDYTYSLMGA